MTLGNDDSTSWVVRRAGIIVTALLIALNAVAITITAIIVSDPTSRQSSNFAALATQWIDGAVFLLAGIVLLGALVSVVVLALRPVVRAVLPWAVTVAVLAGVGWGVLELLQRS